MTEKNTSSTSYETPKIEDYGDLAEITAARTAVPELIDGNYTRKQHVKDPFSIEP